MKRSIACIGVAALLATGCASNDYRGAADDSKFSTPSWGTSTTTSRWNGYNAPGSTSTTRPSDPMGGSSEFEPMTPSADIDHGHAPQMPPTESDAENNQPDFGTQHK